MNELNSGEHEHSAAVEVAAHWLADQVAPPRPLVPALRDRFGLTPVQACETIAMARSYRLLRRAFS